MVSNFWQCARNPGSPEELGRIPVGARRDLRLAMDRKIECPKPHRCCVRPARNNVEPQPDQINCRTSFREATDGRESDMIYVICVAALVLGAYWWGHTQVANLLIKANWKR